MPGGNAVKILQRLLIQMGQGVTVDGLIGAQTDPRAAAAANGGGTVAPGRCLRNRAAQLLFRARGRQTGIAQVRAQRRDGGKGGWITRAEEFISPRFHLSDRQFRAEGGEMGLIDKVMGLVFG